MNKNLFTYEKDVESIDKVGNWTEIKKDQLITFENMDWSKWKFIATLCLH